MTSLSNANHPARATLLAVAFLAFACHPMQEATERGQQAERDAKKLQQTSTYQKPSNQTADAAIRTFEAGKTDIQSLEVVSLVPQDQFDKYIVKVRLNGEERSYGLERDPSGVWTATPPPQ